MKKHSRTRLWLAALVFFAPTLAALWQGMQVILYETRPPKELTITLPVSSNVTTSGTFIPGSMAGWVKVHLFRSKESTEEQESASDKLTSHLLLQVEQNGHRSSVAVSEPSECDASIAQLKVRNGGDYHFTVRLKPGAPSQSRVQHYYLSVREYPNYDPQSDDADLMVLSFGTLALILAITGAILYKRYKTVVQKVA